jgi:hypothetical protein
MDDLKTPSDWEKETGITIIDADGWRGHRDLKPKDYNIKISQTEFIARVIPSTIQISAVGLKKLKND